MVSKLLGRLFGGGGASDNAAPETAAHEEYKGYTLEAAPVKDNGRWRVAGSIVKEVDGEQRRHDFVRADVFPERDDAAQVSLTKGRLMVDQLGDRVFDQST